MMTLQYAPYETEWSIENTLVGGVKAQTPMQETITNPSEARILM